MTAVRLFVHLRTFVEISLNERRGDPIGNFITHSRIFQFAMLRLPFPKGVKAPDYLTPEPTADFLAERSSLRDALQRFVTALQADPNRLGNSPLVGDVTLEFWSQLHAKHLEHHLKQFGV